MENAVFGTENTQRSFPAPPTRCHNRNIPTFAAPYHLHPPALPFLYPPLPPTHVLHPALAQSSRRTNGHSRSYSVGNLISYPAPQSPGTRTLPRGSPLPPIDMSSLLVPLLVLLLAPPFASSHLLHSLSDDPHAFPKYRVTFLNGLPLLNETAERWLREGLRAGEAEFLDHPTPWQEPSPLKHIDGGDGTAVCSLYHITS